MAMALVETPAVAQVNGEQECVWIAATALE
jgi:hypothetical protein